VRQLNTCDILECKILYQILMDKLKYSSACVVQRSGVKTEIGGSKELSPSSKSHLYTPNEG